MEIILYWYGIPAKEQQGGISSPRFKPFKKWYLVENIHEIKKNKRTYFKVRHCAIFCFAVVLILISDYSSMNF